MVQIHTTTVVNDALIPRHSNLVAETSCTAKNHDQQSECRSYRMALLDKNNTSSVILQHKQRGNRSSEDKETGAEVIRHEVEKYWCCSLSVRLMTIVLFIISFSPFIRCHCAKSTRPPSKRHAEKHTDQSSTLSNNLAGFTKHCLTVKL